MTLSSRPLSAALVLVLTACREGGAPAAAASETSAAMAAAVCAPDSLRPEAAAPAAGLWVGARREPPTRVAAMIGPAATDVDRARITRRVETLEVRDGADSIRTATDTASVRLELLPRFGVGDDASRPPRTEPAAVYPISRLVLLASYEPCAASAGEPRLRYLRRDDRGVVALDVMLRRESGETTGVLP